MTRDLAQAKTDFADFGVALVHGLVDRSQIEDFKAESERLPTNDDLVNEHNMRSRYALFPNGERVLDALDPVTDVCHPARAIATAEPLRSALQELLGDEPCLFKDKYILRTTGAPGYPPHQDFIAWPFFPRSFTTVLIAVDPISKDNGGLEFYLGSHKKGLLTKADGDFHTIAHADLAPFEKVGFAMNPGDALIFDAFVVHESKPNLSGASRRALYLSYNAASEGGDQRQSHYRYFHSWLKRRFGEYGGERLFFK